MAKYMYTPEFIVYMYMYVNNTSEETCQMTEKWWGRVQHCRIATHHRNIDTQTPQNKLRRRTHTFWHADLYSVPVLLAKTVNAKCSANATIYTCTCVEHSKASSEKKHTFFSYMYSGRNWHSLIASGLLSYVVSPSWPYLGKSSSLPGAGKCTMSSREQFCLFSIFSKPTYTM